MAPPGRLEFANQLRGLAALSVAFSHLVGVYWAAPGVVAAITGAPPGAPPPPTLAPLVYPYPVSFGPFGVALFFLVSGLVVPLSLGGRRAPFLLARALRIWPTYAAAMLAELAIRTASHAWWQQPDQLNGRALLANLLLINNYVGEPSFDLVNWTLCIEVKFYLLMALLAGAIGRGSLRPLFATAAALCALGALAPLVLPPGSRVASELGIECSYLIFMLIGVLFALHLRGRLGTPALAAGAAVLLATYLLCWYGGTGGGPYVFWFNTVNYLYALALFAALYAARRWIPATPLLDGMAAVSYPFYLIHAIAGFAIVRWLTAAADWPFWPALAATTATLLAIATLLHVTVERWTVRAGRQLRHRPARRPSASLPVNA